MGTVLHFTEMKNSIDILNGLIEFHNLVCDPGNRILAIQALRVHGMDSAGIQAWITELRGELRKLGYPDTSISINPKPLIKLWGNFK